MKALRTSVQIQASGGSAFVVVDYSLLGGVTLIVSTVTGKSNEVERFEVTLAPDARADDVVRALRDCCEAVLDE